MKQEAVRVLEASLSEEQERVAMTSPAQLKRWLTETGRNFIVFKSDDLIDSLAWPRGVQTLMQIVDAYRAHRREYPVETVPCPKCDGYASHTIAPASSFCSMCANTGDVVTRTKTDVLEPDEIDAAIAHLQNLKEAKS